ncbi:MULTISPECIES: hypothetical protein [Rhodococcus]|uniref:hypothetical protein n=1 Tax=Rhodococcus TaxID=1827 RepID=UPI00193C3DAE|nr:MULTISPECIES: hypothetical protein [Rhodococcus]QRI74702.1 hypothetical protein JQ505_19240 [Rhodococcus aetherivorans]QSE58113.1 hypothetical protein JYA75_20350 [Rhodococcus sp. PSBB066]
MTENEPVNLELIARQKGLEIMTSGPNPTDPAVTYHVYKPIRREDEPDLLASQLNRDEAIKFVVAYEPNV